MTPPRRPAQIHLRVDAGQVAAWNLAARRAGLTLSAWIRELADQAARGDDVVVALLDLLLAIEAGDPERGGALERARRVADRLAGVRQTF